METQMHTGPRFSICIPLYNTEVLIRDCLDSVLNQTCADFEAIVVDDGSTDRSGAVAEEYAERDPRIRVVHQKNAGVFHTRITAFEHARGQFVMSLDADDYFEPNALETVEKTLESTGADIVIFNNYILYQGKERITAEPARGSLTVWSQDREEMFRLFESTSMLTAIWRKAIRRDLIRTDLLKDYPRISMGDDWIHSFWPMTAAQKVAYLPDPLLNYRILNTSLTATYDCKLYKTQQIIHDLLLRMKDMGLPASLSREQIDYRYYRGLAKTIAYIPGTVQDRKAYEQMLRDIRADQGIWEGLRNVKLNALFRLPLFLARHGAFGLLYRIKQFSSAVRKRK